MKKITILMTVLLIATFTTFAQHSGGDHKHGSPHGGTVKSAGGFHIEVSVKDINPERKRRVYVHP